MPLIKYIRNTAVEDLFIIDGDENNFCPAWRNWEKTMISKQQFPEPTVGALIFNPENKILVMKSHKWRGKYVIPGGHIELGEKMEDALRREVKEETGLSIFGIKFLLLREFIFDKAFWKKRHFIFFDFVCRTKSSKVTLNSEGQKYVWVTVDEALKLPLEPYSKETIKEFLKQKV